MKRKQPLPIVQLIPTSRETGSFKCAHAYPDPEDDEMYLQVYCRGMDVTLKLDLEQLELIAEEARRVVEEQKELRT
jgi:hypothetical protein